MAYNADTLLDRMRLKRQLRRWKISFVLLIVVFVLASIGTVTDFSAARSDYIATYNLKGFIAEEEKRTELLEKVRDGEHVKALVLHIDSPGGTVVGGESLFNLLREIAEHKPVVSVIHTMGTSGAYMAALGTDRIYAHEGSITGSIGVILQTVEVTELADKLGINPLTYKSGELKAAPSPLEKPTPLVDSVINNVVMDFYRYFRTMVQERRQLDDAVTAQVADGRVFTGRQALDKQLVDAIGSEADALNWLFEEKALDSTLPVRQIKEKRDPAEWVESFGNTLFGWKHDALTGQSGLLAVWSPGLF